MANHDELTSPAPRTARRLGLRWWFAVFAACLLLYLATVNRGVCWQDSGWNQLRALDGDYYRSVPLARAHVLYIAGGHLLGKISPAYMPLAFNALSAFWMSIAVANIAAIGVLLTNRRWIGLGVACVFALMHTVWWLATINESYAWVLAGFTAEIYLLIRLLRKPSWKILSTLGLVSGLGLCVHNFALLPLPVYIIVGCWLVARQQIPAWSLLTAAAGFLVGAGAFVAMIIEAAVVNGSLAWAIRDALTGHYAADVLNIAASGRFWKANMAIASLNFANPLWVLGIVGLLRVRARQGAGIAASLTAIAIIQFVFFVRYPVPDQFMFILPTLGMIAVLGCVGLDAVADWARPKWRAVLVCVMLLSAVAQPVAYAATSRYVQRHFGQVRKRKLPFRNEVDYWLTPWKHDKDSAGRFANAALQTATPNGVIIADGTSIYPLLLTRRLAKNDKFAGIDVYQREEFVRFACGENSADDLSAACRTMFAGRPLFVVYPANLPKKLTETSDLKLEKTPDGSLYRVSWPGS